jgi:hypothetical protein
MGRPKGSKNGESSNVGSEPVPGDDPKPMVRCACSRLKEEGQTCSSCGR